MKRFKNWLVNCQQNRIDAIQNVGFLLFVMGIILYGIALLTPISLLRIISTTIFSIGAVIWLFGIIADVVREKEHFKDF